MHRNEASRSESAVGESFLVGESVERSSGPQPRLHMPESPVSFRMQMSRPPLPTEILVSEVGAGAWNLDVIRHSQK